MQDRRRRWRRADAQLRAAASPFSSRVFLEPLEPRAYLSANLPNATDSSLAYDAAGNLHVAYYDSSSKELFYATQTGDNQWSTPIAVAPMGADPGNQISLAISPSGEVDIAYHDALNSDLKFAQLDGDAWNISTIDPVGDTGLCPQLTFLSNDTPAVTYFSKAGGRLKVAISTTTGWQISPIGKTLDPFTSVAINATNQTPGVAYEDVTGQIYVAAITSNGISSPKKLGSALAGPTELSLAYGPDGRAAVTYQNPAGGVVRLVEALPQKQFSVIKVASVPPGTDPQPALSFNDATGHPQIVYEDTAQDGLFLASFHPTNSLWKTAPLQYGVTTDAHGITLGSNDAIAYSAFGGDDSSTLAIDTTASTPAPPTNVVASDVSVDQINVAWMDAAGDDSGFAVSRSTDGINFTPVATLPAGTITYNDTDLSPGTEYYYEVSAIGSDGSQSLGVVSPETENISNVITAASTGPSSSISGYVYNDAGDVGDFLAASAISAQLTLTGVDSNGNAIIPLIINTNPSTGAYTFGTLNAGTYTLTLTQPSGYLPGKENTSGVIGNIVLAAGQNVTADNFGEVQPASITGTVYNDANDDGVQQQSEAGIASVTMVLSGTDDFGNTVSENILTASNGSYSFANLRPGSYTVTETPPANFLSGKQNSAGADGPLNLTPGSSQTGVSFGELSPASVSGFVYNDANDNGVQDAGDAGIAGITIDMIGETDLGALITQTRSTASNGSYSFTGLRPGSYTIHVYQPPADLLPGQQNSTGNSGSLTISAGSAITGVSFGEVSPINISGFVYNDANDNGVKQSGESGIPSVSIALSGTNDLGHAVSATTTTASDGSYSFTDLRPGTYLVTETAPAGYLAGKQNNSGNSGSLVLAPGATQSAVSFGELSPSSLSGFVYNDANDDGAKQSGESGIASVTITLTGTNDLSQSVNTTATTASDGSYSFANLRPGTYTLSEGEPTGYLHGHDSDGTEASGTAGTASLSSIALGSGITGQNNNFAEIYAPVPSNLTATIVSGAVLLGWTEPSTAVTGFIVQRSVNGGAYSTLATPGASATSISDSAVSGINTYSYTVTAATAVGNTAASQSITAPALNAPSTPINLVATPVSDTEVNLTWDRVGAGETSLVIYRSTSGGPYHELESLPAGSNIITDTSCYPSTAYTYEITAINAAGSSGPSVTSTATTMASEAYGGAAPATDFTATASSPNTINLSWTDGNAANSGANYYDWLLERSINGVAYSIVAVISGSGFNGAPATVTYTDAGLTPGTTYYYRTRAAGSYITSDYDQPVSASTPSAIAAPVEPTGVIATVNSGTSVTIQWTDTNNGQASYLVDVTPAYVDADQAQWVQTQTAPGATSCTITTLPQTAYWVQIAAADTGGNSDYTPVTIFRTASAGTGSPKVYTIGPGEEYSSLGALNWSALGPGDTVEIFPNRDGSGNIIPYYEKPLISVRGTATAPISIIGMPDPTTGQLPIIDGTNAVTAAQWDTDYEPLDDLSLMLIGTTVEEHNYNLYWSPGYLNIGNLQIQNGYAGDNSNLTYTAYDGTIRTYSNAAAGIYIEKGDYITIRGCTIDDNNEGIFGAGQGDSRDLTNLTIARDSIYGNGTIGGYYQHNSYIEGIDTIYEFDDYGALRPGAGGDGLKDRGAGTVIEYCTFSAGGHFIDLDEASNYEQTTLTLPSYRSTYVFGNILYDPNVTSELINYGGDQGVAAFNRKGVLYFYDNTVFITANLGPSFLLFQETTSAESVDAINNIIYVSSQTSGADPAWLDLLQPWGVAYFGSNWIGLYPASDIFVSEAAWNSGYQETGLLAGSANLVYNSQNNDPDFDSIDPDSPQFLHLGALSDAIGQGWILPANCPPVLYEYSGSATDLVRTATADLGAYEYGS